MNKVLLNHLRIAIVTVGSLFVLVLFSACAGVPGGTTGAGSTGTGATNITGTVVSVNAQQGSVTINVNGQQITINGLSAQQLNALQSQINKTFTIQVTQSGNTYTIASGTTPQENDNGAQGVSTPETTTNNGPSVPGTIDFTGTLQSINNSSLTVNMPDGQGLTMNITAQTRRPDDGVMPNQGQLVKATAIANTDGSFTASKFDIAKSSDSQDQYKVSYQGVTTSAVGSDGKLNFKVGNKSFSYQIAPNADLHHFNNNSAQSIGSNVTVKVKVLFNGSTGTVQSVDPANGND